jgi:hypothetical protein
MRAQNLKRFSKIERLHTARGPQNFAEDHGITQAAFG